MQKTKHKKTKKHFNYVDDNILIQHIHFISYTCALTEIKWKVP